MTLAQDQALLASGGTTGCPECDYEIRNGRVGPYEFHSCDVSDVEYERLMELQLKFEEGLEP